MRSIGMLNAHYVPGQVVSLYNAPGLHLVVGVDANACAVRVVPVGTEADLDRALAGEVEPRSASASLCIGAGEAVQREFAARATLRVARLVAVVSTNSR